MTHKERLDKVLSNNGYGTRSQVKKYIKKGLVKVNNIITKDPSYLVSLQDHLTLNEKDIEKKENYYFLLNKPTGFICATEDTKEKTVLELFKGKHKNLKIFPVGRLDKNTEGLLILTTDGKLAHGLLSPKKNVPKVYYAEIQGLVNEEDVYEFQRGIILEDGYVCKPANLKILSTSEISKVEITITEGKFHQIKRMFLVRKKKVIYLKRIQFGNLFLDETLSVGNYRELTQKEIDLLLKLA